MFLPYQRPIISHRTCQSQVVSSTRVKLQEPTGFAQQQIVETQLLTLDVMEDPASSCPDQNFNRRRSRNHQKMIKCAIKAFERDTSPSLFIVQPSPTLRRVQTTTSQKAGLQHYTPASTLHKLSAYDSFARIDENPETFDEMKPICQPAASNNADSRNLQHARCQSA